MKHISRIFSYLILLASTVMAAWGTAGFIEYFSGVKVVIPLQNSNFPIGTQFLHWLIISLSGFTFLIGYFTKWKHTPYVMVVLFACIATMCFIQTFDFMTREDRYSAYAREIIYYIIFSIYLLRSKIIRTHFGIEQKIVNGSNITNT